MARPRLLLGNYDDAFTSINSFFDHFISEITNTGKEWTKNPFSYPRLNIEETATHLVFRFAVPGRTKEELTLEYLPEVRHVQYGDRYSAAVPSPHAFRISGSSVAKTREKEGVFYHHRELYETTFSRVVTLPKTVTGDDYAASLENGILTVQWKKIQPDKLVEAEPRRLAIS